MNSSPIGILAAFYITTGKGPGSDNHRDHRARGCIGVDKDRPDVSRCLGPQLLYPGVFHFRIVPFVRNIDTNQELRIKLKIPSSIENDTMQLDTGLATVEAAIFTSCRLLARSIQSKLS